MTNFQKTDTLVCSNWQSYVLLLVRIGAASRWLEIIAETCSSGSLIMDACDLLVINVFVSINCTEGVQYKISESVIVVAVMKKDVYRTSTPLPWITWNVIWGRHVVAFVLLTVCSVAKFCPSFLERSCCVWRIEIPKILTLCNVHLKRRNCPFFVVFVLLLIVLFSVC